MAKSLLTALLLVCELFSFVKSDGRWLWIRKRIGVALGVMKRGGAQATLMCGVCGVCVCCVGGA